MTRNSTPLDIDDILGVLSARRRRAALRVLLASSDRTTDVSTLAERVRRRCDPAQVSGTTAELEIRLHHTDLPKLDAAGVVAYDRADGRVSYRETAAVEAVLETLADRFE